MGYISFVGSSNVAVSSRKQNADTYFNTFESILLQFMGTRLQKNVEVEFQQAIASIHNAKTKKD